MNYCVYILKSIKSGKFYKGLTNNLEKRLLQHNQGQCDSTKNLLPVKLIYVQVCEDRFEAREWEKFFKSGIGREVIKELAVVVELADTQASEACSL